MNQVHTQSCECEHKSHFDKNKLTPNQNPAHLYGVKFSTNYLRKVETLYGSFVVCKDCAEDCLA
jgi:hypothetical protein